MLIFARQRKFVQKSFVDFKRMPTVLWKIGAFETVYHA